MNKLLTFNWLNLFRPSSASQASGIHHQDKSDIDWALEHLIDETETRIRLIGNYQKTLLEPLINSLEYIDQLVERIPGTIELSRKSFSNDPNVKLFFVNPSHLQEIVSDSSELRDFFDDIQYYQNTEAYALMCMHRLEKRVLGLDLEGEIMRREVEQTAVSFSDHQILSPASDEADARKGLKRCMFKGLINRAKEVVQKAKHEKEHIESNIRLLHSRLRSAEQRQQHPTTQNEIVNLRQRLDHYEERMRMRGKDFGSLDSYLAMVRDVLLAPDEFVRLELQQLTLDNLCIVRGENAPHCHTMELAEVTLGQKPPRIVLLVRIPRSEMLPRKDPVIEAQRFLNYP